MGNFTLPAVNQRVDIWFDGYDEYYGGRVDSVSAPYRFHVVLDDQSQWDIDVRKNIYRLSTDLPDDQGSDGGGGGGSDVDADADENDTEKETEKSAEPEKVDTAANDNADAPDADAANPSNADDAGNSSRTPDKSTSVDRDPTMLKSASIDVSPKPTLRFKEVTKPATTRATRRSSAVAAALAADEAAEAAAEAAAAATPAAEPDADAPATSSGADDAAGPRTRSREPKAAQTAAQRRRLSGRAQRKNVGNVRSASHSQQTDGGGTPDRPRRAAAAAAQEKQLAQRANGADADAALQTLERTPVRVTRSRRDDGSVSASQAGATQSQSTEPRRRGRPPMKRTLAEVEASAAPGSTKRRRRSDGAADGADAGGANANAATSPAAAGRVTRSATAARDGVREEGEKISTKTLTAIAVEAALETSKSVLKPVNDRLNKLLKELEVVTRELVATKKARDEAAPRRAAAAAIASGATPSPAVLSATLENVQVDVSEIIGGGEARIKAYAGLSQSEFDGLHRLIEKQGNALKELDRLLYAAKEFGEKGKQTPKRVVAEKGAAPTAEGDESGAGTGTGTGATATGNGNATAVEAGATKQS